MTCRLLNNSPTCATAIRLALNLGAFRLLVYQEYDKCYNLVKECVPHAKFPYECTSIESFRASY